jgi:hypothetical protein
MATIINCPRQDCANNKSGQCTMARLDIKDVVIVTLPLGTLTYLLCQAFEPREGPAQEALQRPARWLALRNPDPVKAAKEEV